MKPQSGTLKHAVAAQPFLHAPNAMQKFITAQLRGAQQAGDMPADLDAGTEAVGLLAMSAGLGTSVLLGQRTKRQAFDVLSYHLNRLVPAPVAQDGDR